MRSMFSTSSLLFQQCIAGTAPANRGAERRPRSACCSRNPRRLSVCSSVSVSCSSSEQSEVAINVRDDPRPKKRPVLSRPPRSYSVKAEELVPGKILTGSVKSILTFGAFIDVNARFDGLLHISKISDSFVQNVEDFLTLGQEIQVEIVSVDLAKKRLQLKKYQPASPSTAATPAASKVLSSSRENGSAKVVLREVGTSTTPTSQTVTGTFSAFSQKMPGTSKIPSALSPHQTSETTAAGTLQNTSDSSSRTIPAGTSKVSFPPQKTMLGNSGVPSSRHSVSTQPVPKENSQSTASSSFPGKLAGRKQVSIPKPSYQKGQSLNGVVKNLTRRGCFVQLPGNEEGFLHANEINASGEPVPIENLVKVGQEVKVKVLRIIDGRLNLTMKDDVDLKKFNEELNQNVVATNPFELAFRNNAIIKNYLRETGRLVEDQNLPKEKVGKDKELETREREKKDDSSDEYEPAPSEES